MYQNSKWVFAFHIVAMNAIILLTKWFFPFYSAHFSCYIENHIIKNTWYWNDWVLWELSNQMVGFRMFVAITTLYPTPEIKSQMRLRWYCKGTRWVFFSIGIITLLTILEGIYLLIKILSELKFSTFYLEGHARNNTFFAAAHFNFFSLWNWQVHLHIQTLDVDHPKRV